MGICPPAPRRVIATIECRRTGGGVFSYVPSAGRRRYIAEQRLEQRALGDTWHSTEPVGACLPVRVVPTEKERRKDPRPPRPSFFAPFPALLPSLHAARPASTRRQRVKSCHPPIASCHKHLPPLHVAEQVILARLLRCFLSLALSPPVAAWPDGPAGPLVLVGREHRFVSKAHTLPTDTSRPKTQS